MANRLEGVNPKYRYLWLIGVTTGLRVSDVLNIKARDLKLSMPIKEQKTGKRRIVSLSPELLKELKAYVKSNGIQPNEYVIPSTSVNRSKPLSRIQAYKVIKKTSTQLGLKGIGTHSMRKTYAVELYNATGDIFAVQMALNHKYTHTTLAYLIGKGFKVAIIPE